MDTLPLPPRPNLEQYRKRAKDLVTATRSDDESAVRSWAADWLGALAKTLNVTVTPFVQQSVDRAIVTIEAQVREQTGGQRVAHGRFTLSDAHFLIARAHGFGNWFEFVDHVDRLPARDHPFPKVSRCRRDLRRRRPGKLSVVLFSPASRRSRRLPGAPALVCHGGRRDHQFEADTEGHAPPSEE